MRKNETYWRRIANSKFFLFDRFYIPRFFFRPICWIKGHDKHIYYPFGLKVKQCFRCDKEFYQKPTKEKNPLESGEIGQLYGVRFISTTKTK